MIDRSAPAESPRLADEWINNKGRSASRLIESLGPRQLMDRWGILAFPEEIAPIQVACLQLEAVPLS